MRRDGQPRSLRLEVTKVCVPGTDSRHLSSQTLALRVGPPLLPDRDPWRGLGNHHPAGSWAEVSASGSPRHKDGTGALVPRPTLSVGRGRGLGAACSVGPALPAPPLTLQNSPSLCYPLPHFTPNPNLRQKHVVIQKQDVQEANVGPERKTQNQPRRTWRLPQGRWDAGEGCRPRPDTPPCP